MGSNWSALFCGVAALAFLIPSGYGQEVCPPAPQPITVAELQELFRNPRDRGVLWSLEKDGRRSYLYTTIHLNRREWVVLGPTVVKALREAEVIALEIDPTDRALVQAIAAKPEKDLEIPPDLLGRMRRQAERVCLPWAKLEGKGWANILLAISMLSLRREGLEGESGVEEFLAGFARSTKKRIASLETAEEQRRRIWGRSPEEQLQWIEDMLDDLEKGGAAVAAAAYCRAWETGDLTHLAPELEGRHADRLVFQPNPILANRIKALHDSGVRVFAAIGITHTVGDRGVPELLKRHFKVERVQFPHPENLEDPHGQTR